MVRTVGKHGGLTDAVVIDAVVRDVGLIGEGRPGTQDEGILLDGLEGFGEIDRHEPARHLGVGFGLGVVLLASEVPQVLRQQLPASHAPGIVVEIVVHEIDISGVDSGVLRFLIFPDRAVVVPVEDVVIVDEGIGGTGKEIQEKLLDFRIEDTLHFRCVVEVGAGGVEVGQGDPQPVHALGRGHRQTRSGFLDLAGIAYYLGKIEGTPPDVLFRLAQQACLPAPRRILPERVRRHDGIGRMLVDGVTQRQHHPALGCFHAAGANVLHAVVPGAEAGSPPSLDGTRGRIVDPANEVVDVTPGNLFERSIDRRPGPRIAIALK